MASISGISGSVAILKIFYLNLEQWIIVGYQCSYYVIQLWEIRKFLTNGLRESPCILQKKKSHLNTERKVV
jgi:hypothetical protein